ncbi:unnamed protein product [Orchesella dallaii]|uniref:Alpha-carbonic anhydrase domain-containing protein n=1 Tax=Orchesella dallaii TaxID=48710 RepID=A0ABP1RZ69_9HEXA
MVEIAEEINPVWEPLTELYDKIFSKVIEDTCYGESLRQQGQENYDKATLAYTTLLTQQKEETDGLTYQDLFQGLKTFYEAVKCCDSNKILDVETQAAAEFAKAQECDAGLAPNQERMEVVGTQIEDLESKIQQLKANGELYDDEEDALIKAVAEYKKIIEKEEELHACSKKHGDKYIELSRKYAEMQKIRETYKIGPGVENLFHSVADVLKDMNEAQKNLEDLENAKAFYENATSVLEKIETVPSRSIDVRLPFQISWLFPPYGGHYFYNGSSPLPPCGRKVFVIVLEKPITISPEQLRVFQKIPSVHQHDSSVWKKLCDKSADDQEKMSVIEKMDNVVSRFPITNPLPKRVVWYNPKNLQYKMDDGVHMKSSTRRKLKQELENEENSAGTPELRDYWIVMLLCILSYQSYHLDEKLNV